MGLCLFFGGDLTPSTLKKSVGRFGGFSGVFLYEEGMLITNKESGPRTIDTVSLKSPFTLGVDSPFFSAVVLFKNRSPFPQTFWCFFFFRKIRIPGFRMELEVTPRSLGVD